MRRWLHSLLVALLCLTLFMDTARACRYVRHRGRRVAACPPPALPAVPCCPPIGYGDPFAMPAGYVVVRDVPCGPAAWGGMERGGEAWTPIASSHVISDVTSGVIIWDRPVGEFVASTEDAGCACGSVAGWHEGHAAGVIEHGVIEHGVIEHGVIENGVIEHGVIEHGTVIHDAVEHGVVDHGTFHHGSGNTGVVENGTVEHGVVKHAPTIVTDSGPRTAGRADLPAAENPPAGDVPLALPPQRASAIVPPAVAPQAAAALPDLIAPTSGQAPAKAAAPAATDDTRSVVVDPRSLAGPADDAAAAPPAMKREIAPEPAEENETEPAEPMPAKPARDDAAEEEMPAEEADRPPAVAPQKPRAVNLFDEIDDEAPADDLPGATDPADEPVMVDDPADEPLDDAPRPAADAEMADEPESDEAPAEATTDDAGTDEPEMVEEPATEDTEEATTEADAPATSDADDADEKEPAEPADAAACTPPAEPMRRWVDGTGRHQTRGWLVEATATHVRILKVNGRFTTVKRDVLSAEDRDYVSDVVVRTAAGRRAAPPRIDTAGL